MRFATTMDLVMNSISLASSGDEICPTIINMFLSLLTPYFVCLLINDLLYSSYQASVQLVPKKMIHRFYSFIIRKKSYKIFNYTILIPLLRGVRENPMQKIKRIVIPVDTSEASRIATEQGTYFAKLLNVDVTIISVDETRQFMISTILEDKIKKEKESFLNDVQKLAKENGVIAETKLMFGNPAEEIVKHVSDEDLIVMASHGKKGFNKFMLGSVSEEVLRIAPCSVMIIKPKIPSLSLDFEDLKAAESTSEPLIEKERKKK